MATVTQTSATSAGACPCCGAEFECDPCCVEVPATLYMTLTPVGSSECVCLPNPGPTVITLTGSAPGSPSPRTWSFGLDDCASVGAPCSALADFSFSVKCDCNPVSLDFGWTGLGFGASASLSCLCATMGDPGVNQHRFTLVSCNPLRLIGRITSVFNPGLNTECGTLCPGGIEFDVEVDE